VRFSNQPIYQRRRRVALLIFVLLILLLLYVVGLRAGEPGGEQTQQVAAPTVEQAPEVTEEQTSTEETTQDISSYPV
jgi:hypothetical protein